MDARRFSWKAESEAEDEEEPQQQDDEEEEEEEGNDKSQGSIEMRSSGNACQAQNCTADMSGAKQYHRRHKVCEFHSKAAVALVAGSTQRFCQQCSRFHEVSEFDDTKRSCRRRLAGHNQRRRKASIFETRQGITFRWTDDAV